MSVPKTEETLLHGALAAELDLATRQAVLRALDAWDRDQSRPILDHLGEQGILDPATRARIEEAVRIELQRHGNDTGRAPETLSKIAELRASLTGKDWPAVEDDPMATVVQEQVPHAPAPIEESLPTTEADPFATRIEPAPIPSISRFQEASDINPIPSALRSRREPGGTGSGSVLTPNLSPNSSIDIPSGGPSDDTGSDLPRFDPTATPEVDHKSPPGIDPEATSDSGQLPATELDPNATAVPDSGLNFEPLATPAVGQDMTARGFIPGASQSLGTFGYPGASSSRFKVVRPHAKGGLGTVMVAFDEELRREVALKEIQDRHADNPESRARFLLEAEITGGLEHPGVVPVYSLGRNLDGRPYYAMRFIRGDSLRKAIEHFHHLEHGPKDPGDRSLQFRALLRRFIDVCDAMEYAHSRGVIHRDIKPDNVMLGPYGETLVVDWGLAKALDHVEVPSRTDEMPLRPALNPGSTPTLDGSAIGTPAFMSPEQAEGDLSRMGPASDVYSLGATLYQILTGSPPFTERNLFQILIKVRDGEFPPPRQLKPDIPPALEAICLTSMARSVEDRYDSCRGLANDLEHWLADEPVSVYLDPWPVRLGRWAKRHRTLVTGAGVLLLTAVVGLSVGAYLLDQERQRTEEQRRSAVAGWDEAEQKAEEARLNAIAARENERKAVDNMTLARKNEALAKEERRIAEANFQSAVAAVDALLTEVGEIDLADIPQMEQTRRDLLLKAREFYNRFLAQNDSLETRRDAGRAHSRLGDIHELLGEYPQARDSYDKALAIQEPLSEDNPEDADLAADLARTRHNLAVLLKKLNEFEESQALLNQARSTRAELLERDPDNLDAKSDLASSIYQLGAVLARLVGRQQEARDLYDQAITMQREVVAGRDGLEEDRRELARYLNNLALLLLGTEPEQARQAFDEAITLQRRLAEENSDVPHYTRELARTLNNRARDAIVNDPDAAEPPLREAIALAERLSQDFPKVPDYWSELGGYLSNLGRALSERGRRKDDQASAKEAESLFQRSEEAYRRSEAIRTELVEQYPSRPEYRHRLALIRHSLATFLRLRAKGEEAKTILDSSIESLRDLVESNPEVPEYQKDLALALRERAFSVPETSDGKAAALKPLGEALASAESASQARPGDSTYWATLMGIHALIGAIDRDLGQHRDAREHALFLAGNAHGDATWLYNAAELMLNASVVARQHEAITKEQFESEFGESIRLLRDAAGAGFDQPAKAELVFKEFLDRPEVKEALDRIRSQSEIDR